MKKNLISVLILALVLADLVLTAVLAFTIIPQTKKANELIDKVCSAISLELESGQNMSSIPIEDIEMYNVVDQFTCNLADSGDGKDHFAVFSIGFSMNIKSDEYGTIGSEGLAAKETIIKDQINSIVSTYTLAEFKADGNVAVKQEILRAMQELFGPEFIIGVSFSSVNAQ